MEGKSVMNREKELLLKLLMEKYEGEDLEEDDCDGDDGEDLNTGYYGVGGREYRVVEPEVWEEAVTFTLPLPSDTFWGARGSMAYPLLVNVAGCDSVRIACSTYNNLKVTVVGGDPHKIAHLLYRNTPSGITLVGHLNVVVKDFSGCDRFVSFNYEYA